MEDAPPRGRPLARYAPAFAVSFLLHALVFAAAAGWLIGTSADRAPARARPRERAVQVFVAAREDPAFPGLNPVDATHSAFEVDDMPSTLSSGEFRFDAAKIADRAHLLFPFLSPGLSWDHFAPAPERSIRPRLENPF